MFGRNNQIFPSGNAIAQKGQGVKYGDLARNDLWAFHVNYYSESFQSSWSLLQPMHAFGVVVSLIMFEISYDLNYVYLYL